MMAKHSFALAAFLYILLLCAIAQPDGSNTELVNRGGCANTKSNILLVSLMNGEVKAIDYDTGSSLWVIHTGQKLLSSSISSLEVVYNGMPTRLVPSLDGSLFRFQDESFEPLPFSAETLLSSSFKLAGDSTVVGSKELRTIGLSPTCGDVYYKCDKEGCERVKRHDLQDKDVLVVKHLTHTVRAASLRNGEEKWNFSVGHHELTFSEASMPMYTDGADTFCDKPKVKFSVPDGVVIRLDHLDQVSWEKKLGAPVAKSWILSNGHLEMLDLLDTDYLMLQGKASNLNNGEKDNNAPAPSLYIGVYERQVYLQPSERVRKNMSAISNFHQHGITEFVATPRVRWAPYLTSSPSRTPWLNYGKSDPSLESPKPPSHSEGHALSVFNPTMDYPYDQGFYLIVQDADDASVDEETEDTGFPTFEDFDNIMVVQIVSLKYYWKEVVVISIVVAVILNGFLYVTRAYRRRLQNRLKCLGGSADDSDVSHVSDVSGDTKKKKKRKSVKTEEAPAPLLPPPYPYQSRYQSDFTHIQCLGKGGFGVVFHARNTLDERDYAIKRVSLPNSAEAKEKVMREVKALAMLDHPSIVRYFQAWFETPPLGWQEDQDKLWESTENFLPTPMNSGCPYINPPATESRKLRTKAKEKDKEFFIPKLKIEEPNLSDNSFGFPLNKADDSLDIVFASHSGEISVPANQPFHKYAVAPAELDHDLTESDSEWDHLEDSGYHKNRIVLVGSTESLGEDESQETESSISPASSAAASTTSKTTKKESQSKLFLYIQMQLCKKETLRDYMNANTLHRDKTEVLIIFRQICDAVEYIHSQGMIHRDLKPTNIFFSTENTIKVGDFGLVVALSNFPDAEGDTAEDRSTLPEVNLTNNVGTQLYMSPEQVSRKQYNNKVDIFALGMLFFELKYPFSTIMERVYTLQGIKKQKYPERFMRELPKEHKFIKWMLTKDPKKRPTISDVLHSDVMEDSDDLVQDSRRSRTISRSSTDRSP
ncbi:eukaryotic translation initiation factor 2-alpha kinase 3-like [Watersipora subatra]|uniref:eukaryotic translation initiation factor 2-alpha kinase 3-like n=1 Tax=Watersipora subatra TaxID=2589382 RepID=UPI00355AD567